MSPTIAPYGSVPPLMGAGRVALSSWLSSPHPLVHEAFHRAGFDLATIDMQHGVQGRAEVRDAISLSVQCNMPVVVRVPVADLALASWALDMGACGIIMPMIETVDDAKAFVKAVKYPPVGLRSFGPTRATVLLGGGDMLGYVDSANKETLAFGMIETRTALEAIDEIAAIDGLDGLFVGPSDLSIAISDDHKVDPRGERNEAAMVTIVEAANRAGKIPAIYAKTTEDARHYAGVGFRYICVSSDLGVIAEGAKRVVTEARG